MPEFDFGDIDRGINFSPIVPPPFIPHLSGIPALLCLFSGIGLLLIGLALVVFSPENLIGACSVVTGLAAIWFGLDFSRSVKSQNSN